MAISALGKEVNMAALISRNETVRAVGNMKVNARGDLLDSNNNVITSANKRVESNYDKTVTDSSGLQPHTVEGIQDGLDVDTHEELLPEEQDLFDDNEENEK